MARRFSQHPARRSVVFVNFGAEELGLIGSRVFVENSPIPMSDVITMVNLDMVGRLRGNFLILYSNAAGRFRQVVDSVERIPPAMDFRVSWKSATAETSDQSSFADAHIPVFGAFTDFHADYHRAGDIVSRINFAGLEKVV
jgi:Zn-dependent M28 family amino/carboxypeptidase